MTRNELQRIENKKVMDFVRDFSPSLEHVYLWPSKQLRNCSAEVFTSPNGRYIVLKSYRTFIAVIDTETNTVYDYLRWVFGYTSTSAQHISKFISDYGRHCTRLTWKDVPSPKTESNIDDDIIAE